MPKHFDIDAEWGGDRTTSELMMALSDDIERCHEMLVESIDNGEEDAEGNVSADYEFHARQLVRAIFAYIEATTFSVKAATANRCLDNGIDLTLAERLLSVDVAYRLEKDGTVVEQTAKPDLAANVRFMFDLLERCYGNPKLFDPGTEWWQCLKESIVLRNRLMHPRYPAHIDISGKEIVSILKAREGFTKTILQYTQSNG